jgi:hypothetical protein
MQGTAEAPGGRSDAAGFVLHRIIKDIRAQQYQSFDDSFASPIATRLS